MRWDTLIKVYLGLEKRGYYAMLRKRTQQVLELLGKKDADMSVCVCAMITALLLVRNDIVPPKNFELCLEKLGITDMSELSLKVGRYMSNRGRKRSADNTNTGNGGPSNVVKDAVG